MEHIFFEVQLCIKISIFKEKHVFDILIILCLMTSLVIVRLACTVRRHPKHLRLHSQKLPLIMLCLTRKQFVDYRPPKGIEVRDLLIFWILFSVI